MHSIRSGGNSSTGNNLQREIYQALNLRGFHASVNPRFGKEFKIL